MGDGAGGTLAIDDFQAIVYDNRFMAMSVNAGLIYDGPLTMFGDEFTAAVSVYLDGLRIHEEVRVSGTLVEGSTVSGAFEGEGEGEGVFDLMYSLENQSSADLTRIFRSGLNPWSSPVGGSSGDLSFRISANGSLFAEGNEIPDGTFQNCDLTEGKASPITESSVYGVAIGLWQCDPEVGANRVEDEDLFYGFMATHSNDEVLVFIVTRSNAPYAIGGDFR